MITTTRLQVNSSGGNQMLDVTPEAMQAIQASGCRAGLVTLFVAHTTAAITIGEYEPGLIADMPAAMERIAPSSVPYRHNALNHDDNAHSHLRGSIIGQSLSVPFEQGELVLGAWQRIILIDFDTHPRARDVVIQVMGE